MKKVSNFGLQKACTEILVTLKKSYAKGKLPVSSFAIFFGATFELLGVDEGWVGDSS